MGYMHIDNLYKNQTILMFKECYALEKVHGTSAHISFKDQITFSSGGAKHEHFKSLFKDVSDKFKWDDIKQDIVVFGEAHGGKFASSIYGKNLKFVVFDVKIDDLWLSVPNAEDVAVNMLGLEFVDYKRITTNLIDIDTERDRPSVQSIRNGIKEPKKREGVVLRPIVEVKLNNGNRVMAKHKHAEEQETSTPREVSPERLKVLEDAREIAEEWVTNKRLEHVLQKVGIGIELSIKNTKDVNHAMIEDVIREGKGEIVDSPEARKAISIKAAELFKQYLKGSNNAID